MGEMTSCNLSDLRILQRYYGKKSVRLVGEGREGWPDAVRAVHADSGEPLAWFGSIPEECRCG